MRVDSCDVTRFLEHMVRCVCMFVLVYDWMNLDREIENARAFISLTTLNQRQPISTVKFTMQIE